jgi:hypothetical protein
MLKDSNGNYRKLEDIVADVANRPEWVNIYKQAAREIKEYKATRPADTYHMPICALIDGVAQIYFITDKYDAKKLYDFIIDMQGIKDKAP